MKGHQKASKLPFLQLGSYFALYSTLDTSSSGYKSEFVLSYASSYLSSNSFFGQYGITINSSTLNLESILTCKNVLFKSSYIWSLFLPSIQHIMFNICHKNGLTSFTDLFIAIMCTKSNDKGWHKYSVFFENYNVLCVL